MIQTTAFRHRVPQLWPQRGKPEGINQYQVNPKAPLARGLVSLSVMESGQSPGFHDMAVPSRVLTPTGTGAYLAANSPFGGSYASSSDDLSLFPSPVITIGQAFTVSVFVFKVALVSRGFVAWCNQGPVVATLAPLYFDNGATHYGSDFASAVSGTTPTTWHRVTLTSNATTNVSQFYINGVASGAAGTATAIAGNIDQIMGDTNNGVRFPTVDMFIWDRALSAQEVSAHYNDPYGTILRPRFADLPRPAQGKMGWFQPMSTLKSVTEIVGY